MIVGWCAAGLTWLVLLIRAALQRGKEEAASAAVQEQHTEQIADHETRIRRAETTMNTLDVVRADLGWIRQTLGKLPCLDPRSASQSCDALTDR